MSSNDMLLMYCPECNRVLEFEVHRVYQRCEKCYDNQKIVKCRKPDCKFQKKMCLICAFREVSHEPGIHKKSQCKSTIETSNKNDIYFTLILMVAGLIFAYLLYFLYSPFYSDSSGFDESVDLNLQKLREEFPLQKNETWYHFLSVLEVKNPTVKSITFLHGNSKSTADCLTNKLVSLYSNNKNFTSEEITFSSYNFDAEDYGIALEHYHKIVQKSRVFVTDLTKVTGNIARIFHTLCDEITSDIKPSLFIFTLKYNVKTKYLKPIERATTILKESWNDLPENEIFPLLSRIIKNVVDVVPEEDNKC